jgi:hypothetical protein
VKIVTPFSFPSFCVVEKEHSQINFGKVAIGQKQISTISVKNLTGKKIMIKCRGINPYGPFYLARAIRPTKPGYLLHIHVGFKPESDHGFFSILELYEGNTVERIKLFAEGISPTISLDLPTNDINFGNIVVGDTVSKTFKITNTSTIPIECIYLMNRLECTSYTNNPTFGTQNTTGHNPFNSSPMRSNINPGASCDISIRFSPDRQSDLFLDVLTVIFQGQKESTNIKLSGRAWGTSVCVLGYEQHPFNYRDSQITRCINSASHISGVMSKLYPGKTVEEANIDEETLSKIFLSIPNRKDTTFVTFDMKWIKIAATKLGYDKAKEDTFYWRIDCKDIVLANLKPSLLKLDGKKCDCEFSIEEYSDTFIYDEFLHDYIFQPSTSINNNSGIKFVLDSKKGSIEFGNTKTLKVTALDKMRNFHDGCLSAWEKYDCPVSKSFTMNNYENNTVKSKVSIAVDPINMRIPLPDCESAYFKLKMQHKEVSEPTYIETVYKIKMKGGYRFLEPKGSQGENECQTFFIKIRASL